MIGHNLLAKWRNYVYKCVAWSTCRPMLIHFSLFKYPLTNFGLLQYLGRGGGGHKFKDFVFLIAKNWKKIFENLENFADFYTCFK
jgi:hypothetical protein